jgi:hypothetical protein
MDYFMQGLTEAHEFLAAACEVHHLHEVQEALQSHQLVFLLPVDLRLQRAVEGEVVAQVQVVD